MVRAHRAYAVPTRVPGVLGTKAQPQLGTTTTGYNQRTKQLVRGRSMVLCPIPAIAPVLGLRGSFNGVCARGITAQHSGQDRRGFASRRETWLVFVFRH